jgi:hypothetical protein
MKKSIYYLLCLAWLILLAACGPSGYELKAREKQKSDSVSHAKLNKLQHEIDSIQFRYDITKEYINAGLSKEKAYALADSICKVAFK